MIKIDVTKQKIRKTYYQYNSSCLSVSEVDALRRLAAVHRQQHRAAALALRRASVRLTL